MEKNNHAATHRVGTLTLGCMLILFGMLFLIHMIVPVIGYLFIFRLWPCIFIMLGIEVLFVNCKKNVTFIYDAGAVVLLLVLSLFAVVMAVTEECMIYSSFI